MDVLILPLILSMTAVMEVKSQTNGDIRLMYGGNTAEGAVFMYKDNRWWPICSERWTIYEAKIACKQLDFPYPYAESSSLPSGIRMNVSAYRVWLDGFNCWLGYETRLNECWYGGWGTCSSGVPAGVTCYKDTASESDSQFSWKFIWIGMAVISAIVSIACYKKRDSERMRSLRTTVRHQQPSSNLEEPYENSLDAGNQEYPTSPITHNMATAFNSENNKNTTYITLPQSFNQHLSSRVPTAPEELIITTTRIEGNTPRREEWARDHTPVNDAGIVSAPPPVGFAPPPAYQIPDPLPLQGFLPYPSQDPSSHETPPTPPGPIPPPPTYEEATQH